ncbi:MAG: hypothetical protein V1735_04215 [Nanoarchaeota archaeon]
MGRFAITIILAVILCIPSIVALGPDQATIDRSDYLKQAVAEGCDLKPLTDGSRTVWVADCARPSPANFRYHLNETRRIVHPLDEFEFTDSKDTVHSIIPAATPQQEMDFLTRHKLPVTYNIAPELLTATIQERNLWNEVQVKDPDPRFSEFNQQLPDSRIKRALFGQLPASRLTRQEKETLVRTYPGSITLPKNRVESLAKQNNLTPYLSKEQRIALARELGLRPKPALIQDGDVVHVFGIEEPTQADIDALRQRIQEDEAAGQKRFKLEEWQKTDEELRMLLLPFVMRPDYLLADPLIIAPQSSLPGEV